MPDPKGIRPEDMLPDGVDSGEINGTSVRKGSVAAFVANAKRLETLDPGTAEYEAASGIIRELTPALTAVGVFEVFSPRTERLRALLDSETIVR